MEDCGALALPNADKINQRDSSAMAIKFNQQTDHRPKKEAKAPEDDM